MEDKATADGWMSLTLEGENSLAALNAFIGVAVITEFILEVLDSSSFPMPSTAAVV